METVLQEFRLAIRMLRKSPGFAIAAVLTLALGIGANTAIFSVVDGVLLRPAPFPEMDRLAMVWETDRKSSTTREPASVPDFADFQARSTRLDRLAAFAAGEASITPADGEAFRVAALAMSHDFLPMVGLQPAVGRVFSEADDSPNGPRVILISDALWERAFARDPGIVGRTLSVNDVPREIIGVLPPGADFGALQILKAAAYSRGFADRGGQARVDLWVPLQADPQTMPRDNHPILVVGRLTAGATVAQAQEELGRVAAELEAAYPVNDARGVHVEALSAVVFGPVRPALLLLLGAVALVLLVACANVANLMLARGAARMSEVTVRTALGAGIGRLARQFLIESLVLTAAGTALGVYLASIGLDLLLALAPADIPRVTTVGIDGRVLVATIAVALLVTIAFGLIPTLQARRQDLHAALGGGRSGSASRRQRRLRSGLVIAELALAVMLMVGAGLLIRSLWRLQQVDPGFRTADVIKGEYQLPASRYPRDFAKWPNWVEARTFNEELTRRVAALPGVEAVAIAATHPLDAGNTSSIAVVGREAEAGDWPEPSIRLATPAYFDALGVPLRSGRVFALADDAAATPVILVNEAARRRYFASGDPLGTRIRLWGAERLVIGVVGDERFLGLAKESPPAVYLPLSQVPSVPGSYSILVRTRAPAALAPSLRATFQQLDAALPLFGVEPLSVTVSNSLGQRRFTMLVLGSFAALALILAIIGVHGVLSYTVVQRTREIGIRMALGADPRTVRRLVVSEGAALTAAGLAIGLAGALAISRLFVALLYGVTATDPITFVGVALVLGAVALLASVLPARRAARVDPMVALRSE